MKATSRWSTFYNHGNVIPTLCSIETHRPETILNGVFLSKENIILASLPRTILMNSFN